MFIARSVAPSQRDDCNNHHREEGTSESPYSDPSPRSLGSGGTIARLPDVERNDFDRANIVRHHHSRVYSDSFIIVSIDTAIMRNTSAYFAVVVFECSVLVDVRLKDSRIAKNSDGFR